MRVFRCIALFLVSLCSLGCSKALTEDGAKALIKEAVGASEYYVSVDPLFPLMSQSEIDYTASDSAGYGNVIKRLVEGGHLRKSSQTQSYPKITGTFEGIDTCAGHSGPVENPEKRLDFVLANRNSRCFAYIEKISLYTNRSQIGGEARNIPVEGAITPPNFVSFSRLAGFQGADGPFWYIERAERAYLVGAGPYLWVGSPSGQSVDVTTFNYTFDPGERVTERGVAVGRIEIDQVTDLRLVIETQATATFSWHAALGPIGKVLLAQVPSGSGSASFAKKPDGSWVLAERPAIPAGSI